MPPTSSRSSAFHSVLIIVVPILFFSPTSLCFGPYRSQAAARQKLSQSGIFTKVIPGTITPIPNTNKQNRHQLFSTAASSPLSESSPSSTATATSTDVIVGGVFSLTGQHTARSLGTSKRINRVTALIQNDSEGLFYNTLETDDKRSITSDGVSPLLVNNAATLTAVRFDAVVIATDEAPSAESVRQLISDGIACGATTAVFLSRSPPAGDLGVWNAAEEAAITAARSSNQMKSLTIIRTAELLGGPYYALNPDLLLTANSKYIGNGHKDFRVSVASDGNEKETNVQGDFGTSRLIAGKVLEAALALRREQDSQREDESDLDVSVLTLVSCEGSEPSETEVDQRVSKAILASSTKMTALTQTSTTTAPPLSAQEILSPLTSPQTQAVFKNPFMAPAAVSGPYWFIVFLTVLGFGLASQEWTWCNVGWAVNPESFFHIPATKITCSCNGGVPDAIPDYSMCKPTGPLSEGYFRFFKR